MSDISKFLNASQKAVDFFLKHLDPQGALNAPDAPRDICVYYKLVTLMLVSGRNLEANRILDHIQKSFLQPNGDLRSKADGGRENKSVSGALCEYCAYSNGWIAMAAQRTGRFDISYPTWAYMEKFFHPTLGGATTRAPYGEENNVMDVLSTAHLGLTALYFGDIKKAKMAGDCLKKFLTVQPDLSDGFYCRMQDDGQPITDFPAEAAFLQVVRAKEPNQAYFMTGYPAAFLGKLFLATQEESYLQAAKSIMDFSLGCNESIFSFFFAHKVGWAASLLAAITKEEKYVSAATKIATHLCSLQNSEGAFLPDKPAADNLDQTAEIAIWLKEISSELSKLSDT